MKKGNENESFRMARRPSKDEGRIVYPLKRCGVKPLGGMIILSHDIIGCYTHYWCRRTIPCRTEECPACEKGYTARWHGWIFVMDGETQHKGIFEFTAGASAPLDRYFRQHRRLRGAALRAYRSPPKPNGRLLLEISESKFDMDVLPKAVAVLPILMRMWHARYEPRIAEDGSGKINTDKEFRIHRDEEKKTG